MGCTICAIVRARNLSVIMSGLKVCPVEEHCVTCNLRLRRFLGVACGCGGKVFPSQTFSSGEPLRCRECIACPPSASSPTKRRKGGDIVRVLEEKVACAKCGRFAHRSCVFRPDALLSSYSCPNCCDPTISQRSVPKASSLRETHTSRFIQERLRREPATVRVLASTSDGDSTTTTAIGVFMSFAGRDVLTMVFYAVENCATRRVCLTYLDSLKMFAGSAADRTAFKRRVLTLYNVDALRRGFSELVLWAMPPFKQDDYLLPFKSEADYTSPPSMSSEDKLRAFYGGMSEGVREEKGWTHNILHNIGDLAFDDGAVRVALLAQLRGVGELGPVQQRVMADHALLLVDLTPEGSLVSAETRVVVQNKVLYVVLPDVASAAQHLRNLHSGASHADTLDVEGEFVRRSIETGKPITPKIAKTCYAKRLYVGPGEGARATPDWWWDSATMADVGALRPPDAETVVMPTVAQERLSLLTFFSDNRCEFSTDGQAMHATFLLLERLLADQRRSC